MLLRGTDETFQTNICDLTNNCLFRFSKANLICQRRFSDLLAGGEKTSVRALNYPLCTPSHNPFDPLIISEGISIATRFIFKA